MELPLQLFVSRNGKVPKKELFRKIENRDYFPKPSGGLWTSTFTTPEERKSTPWSAWLEWCFGKGMTNWVDRKNLFLIQPLIEEGRLYVIDSQIDLLDLAEKYPTRPSRDLGLKREFLDFEKIALDYDAIHLTEQG